MLPFDTNRIFPDVVENSARRPVYIGGYMGPLVQVWTSKNSPQDLVTADRASRDAQLGKFAFIISRLFVAQLLQKVIGWTVQHDNAARPVWIRFGPHDANDFCAVILRKCLRGGRR